MRFAVGEMSFAIGEMSFAFGEMSFSHFGWNEFRAKHTKKSLLIHLKKLPTLTSQINDRGRLLIFEEKGPEVGLIEERSFIVFAENFPWGR